MTSSTKPIMADSPDIGPNLMLDAERLRLAMDPSSTLGKISQAMYTYINFLQWLGLPRQSWLKSAGRCFSDIEVLKIPDELLALQGEVRSLFDRWTQVGEQKIKLVRY